MAADIHEQLTTYTSDAHSIEVQALAQLEKAPEVAKYPAFEQALREHYEETERHERLTRQLLDDRGASPSRLKDMIMSIGGKGFLAFARAQPDTPGSCSRTRSATRRSRRRRMSCLRAPPIAQASRVSPGSRVRSAATSAR